MIINYNEMEQKVINIEILSGVWVIGILFTNGFLQLTGNKIFWSIFIWAYYLGQHLGGFIL